MKLTAIAVTGMLTWAVASQAGTANVTETQKENLSAQARVLAIAAANLEHAVRGRALTDAEAPAAAAVAKFHSCAENMARVTERWPTPATSTRSTMT